MGNVNPRKVGNRPPVDGMTAQQIAEFDYFNPVIYYIANRQFCTTLRTPTEIQQQSANFTVQCRLFQTSSCVNSLRRKAFGVQAFREALCQASAECFPWSGSIAPDRKTAWSAEEPGPAREISLAETSWFVVKMYIKLSAILIIKSFLFYCMQFFLFGVCRVQRCTVHVSLISANIPAGWENFQN